MTKNQIKIYNWFKTNKGYVKKGILTAYKIYQEKVDPIVSEKDFIYVINEVRKEMKGKYYGKKESTPNYKKGGKFILTLKRSDFKDGNNTFLNYQKSKIAVLDLRNVLIIGDTHEPFCREDYIDHCLRVQKEYKCGTVVHIGDLVDNHAVSYHEHDPDGSGIADEYKLALEKCKKWYEAFPNVKICIGNHDRLPFRKAFTAGLPKNWLKSYQEMFNSPKGWEWDFIHKIHGVIYMHGTGMSGEMASINAARENRESTVIGHLHTVSNIRFLAAEKDLIFGMSVGCGIDHTKYAFAYGKEAPRKPVLSCGVVINGKLPINIPMNI